MVTPERGDNGRRLYTDEQIQRIALIQAASQAGRSVAAAAEMTTDALRELVAEDHRHEPTEGWAEWGVDQWLERIGRDGSGGVADDLYEMTVELGLGNGGDDVVAQLIGRLARHAPPVIAPGPGATPGETSPSAARAEDDEGPVEFATLTDLLTGDVASDAEQAGRPRPLGAGARRSALGQLSDYLERLARGVGDGGSGDVAAIVGIGSWPDQVAAQYVALHARRGGWSVPSLGLVRDVGEGLDVCREVGAGLLVLVGETRALGPSDVGGLAQRRQVLPGWVDVVVAGAGSATSPGLEDVGGVDVAPSLTEAGQLVRGRGKLRFGRGRRGAA